MSQLSISPMRNIARNMSVTKSISEQPRGNQYLKHRTLINNERTQMNLGDRKIYLKMRSNEM